MKYQKESSKVKSTNQKVGLAFLISIIIGGLIVLALGIFTAVINQQLKNDLNYNATLNIYFTSGTTNPFGPLLTPQNVSDLRQIFNLVNDIQSWPFIAIGSLFIIYGIVKLVTSRKYGIVSLYFYDYFFIIIAVLYVLGVSIGISTAQIIARNNINQPGQFCGNSAYFIATSYNGTKVGCGSVYAFFNLITGADIGYIVTAAITFAILVALIVITILALTGRLVSVNVKLYPTKEQFKDKLLLDYKPKLGVSKPSGFLGTGKTQSADPKFLEHKKRATKVTKLKK